MCREMRSSPAPFALKLADESHRARLRVEMGRLRSVLRPLAEVSATKRGFALDAAQRAKKSSFWRGLLKKHAAVLALLADGESWSTLRARACAGREPAHRAARARFAGAAAGKVQSFGDARARRWMTPPMPGFTTTLLLPAALPID